MIIYGRDARTGPRSLKHLFSGQYRNPEANRLSGVYELSLRRASEAGSPGRTVLVCRHVAAESIVPGFTITQRLISCLRAYLNDLFMLAFKLKLVTVSCIRILCFAWI